jgi:trimethylamine---corrinoid protein Co-methyltransferase
MSSTPRRAPFWSRQARRFRASASGSGATWSRRPGTLADNANFIRLSQHFDIVHLAGGGSVDALDIHASIRHLHVYRQKAHLSDKVPFVTSTGRYRLFDGFEIMRLAHGLSEDEFRAGHYCFSVINTNSPLKLDGPMAMGIIELARNNQITCVTPFTLSGAMAPVTIAGAIVLQNAEALAGLVLNQLARPGAPFIYGGFTSNVDMRSGAPAFGTPEYMKACLLGGQLARRYRLPYRTSSTNAANSVDAQAGYESAFSLWGAIMGGGNLLIHSFGWLEGGLVASYEKFILDVELLNLLADFLREEPRRPPSLFPALSFTEWAAAGSPHAWKTAGERCKRALEEYREPGLPPERAAAIDHYVRRRESEGGEPTDF